jgi:hypothetical protein
VRYLDPKNYRIDQLLLRPLHSEAVRWGEEGVVRLQLTVEGESVEAAEGVWRPSHTSVFGVGASELQVTEDRFQAEADASVSVVSLRNAGPYVLDVALEFSWESAHPVRIAPPGDDLVQRLAPNARLQLIFAAAESREMAERWAAERDPVRTRQETLQAWVESQLPRFDCPDPGRMDAFYTACYRRWLRADPSGDDETIAALLVPALSNGELTLRPGAHGMAHFCLADWRVGKSLLTVVWDDPSSPGDAYDDGLKGLAVWKEGRRVHLQDDLAPLTIAV